MINSIARKCLMVDHLPENELPIYETYNKIAELFCLCNKYYYPGNETEKAEKYFAEIEDRIFVNLLYTMCNKEHIINIDDINKEYGVSGFTQILNIGCSIIEEHELVVDNILMNQKTYEKIIPKIKQISENDNDILNSEIFHITEDNDIYKVYNYPNIFHIWGAHISICNMISDNHIFFIGDVNFLGVIPIIKECDNDKNILIDHILLEEGMSIINNYAICLIDISNYENQKAYIKSSTEIEKEQIIESC